MRDGEDKPRVERLRLEVERQLSALVRKHPRWTQAVDRMRRPDYSKTRRLLMAQAMFVSSDMAPNLYRLARKVQRRLGSEGELEIFQSQGGDEYGIDAGVFHVVGQAQLIHIQGRVLTHLDEAGQAVVLGHEVGHLLAHGPLSPLPVVPAVAWVAAQDLPSPAVQRVARAFSMAAELTADRFGLLAGGDLDAFLRVEMVHASGLPVGSMDWEPQAYLNQCRHLMEETKASGESALGTTHPEHNLRAYGAWLFSETEVFGQLTGTSTSGRSLDEVDGILRRLMLPQGLPSWRASVPFSGGAGTGPSPSQARAFSGKAGPMRSKAAPRESDDDSAEGATGQQGARQTAAAALRPGLSRLKDATVGGLARVVGRRHAPRSNVPDNLSEEVGLDDTDDLLEDPEEKALLERFAELERKLGKSDD